jgi:ADP-ribose pyrophosphatase YjhB (NUDIX family)
MVPEKKKGPRFCTECGGDLENRQLDERVRPVCTKCSHVHYGQLIVGAGGLVEVGNRLLLIWRMHEPFQDSWCLPGGHVDSDESPSAAAQRETGEETGLEVAAGELVGAYFFDDHPAGCGVFLVYRCAILAGTPTDTAEGSKPTFFGRDEIPDCLAGGGHSAAIEAWVNSASKSQANGTASARSAEPSAGVVDLQRVNLQNQLAVVWNARAQQDQVLWRIFAAFWPTNAILLAALFRSSGQTLPPSIGAITACSGIFVAIVWFLIQRRALGHIKRIESTADRLERAIFDARHSAYALSPRVNTLDAGQLSGVPARSVMPFCTGAVGVLWLLGLGYFILQF